MLQRGGRGTCPVLPNSSETPSDESAVVDVYNIGLWFAPVADFSSIDAQNLLHCDAMLCVVMENEVLLSIGLSVMKNGIVLMPFTL